MSYNSSYTGAQIEEKLGLVDSTKKTSEIYSEASTASTNASSAVTTANNALSAAANIKGILNCASDTTSTLKSAMLAMPDNSAIYYSISDKATVSTSSSVTFNSSLASFITKAPYTYVLSNWVGAGTANTSLGASNGDLLVVIKAKVSSVNTWLIKIIPLNDAKVASGDFPGCDGLETIWDKTQINKIPDAITELGKKLSLPHNSEANMNNALTSGIYYWCNLGRPAGSTGYYTCVVLRSSDADGNGYYSIEQTAYGRTDELGRVFKRMIFWKSSSDSVYLDWVEVTASSSSSDSSDSDGIDFSDLYIVTASDEGTQYAYPAWRTNFEDWTCKVVSMEGKIIEEDINILYVIGIAIKVGSRMLMMGLGDTPKYSADYTYESFTVSDSDDIFNDKVDGKKILASSASTAMFLYEQVNGYSPSRTYWNHGDEDKYYPAGSWWLPTYIEWRAILPKVPAINKILSSLYEITHGEDTYPAQFYNWEYVNAFVEFRAYTTCTSPDDSHIYMAIIYTSESKIELIYMPDALGHLRPITFLDPDVKIYN
jgi:hypothetical protein